MEAYSRQCDGKKKILLVFEKLYQNSDLSKDNDLVSQNKVSQFFEIPTIL